MLRRVKGDGVTIIYQELTEQSSSAVGERGDAE